MERHFQQPWLFISCIVDFTQVLDGRPPHPRRGMKVLVQGICGGSHETVLVTTHTGSNGGATAACTLYMVDRGSH